MAYTANLIDEAASNQQVQEALAALNSVGQFGYNDSNGYLAGRDSSFSDYVNLYNQGYQSQYASDIDTLFDKVMNYGDFSYDSEKDNLFQMYKQQYQREGQQAMKNQLGAATAQTGGYNSSYAQSSAQQAYQSSMDKLGDKALDLYSNVYSQWQNEYNQLNDRYNILKQADQQAEASYYNKLSASSNAYNMYNNLYSDDYQNQYNEWSDKTAQAQTNYNNAVSQNNWIKNYNATETNNANTLNQQEQQFNTQQAETTRHNNTMEKIAQQAAKGKTTTTKKTTKKK